MTVCRYSEGQFGEPSVLIFKGGVFLGSLIKMIYFLLL